MDKTSLLVKSQRDYFNKGQTRAVSFRLEQLKKLKSSIIKNRESIYAALKMDLNKSQFEAYETEISVVLRELNYISSQLKSWAKPDLVYTPIVNFPAISHIHKEPYGVVLIMSPWNYPFQLVMLPLIGAIAAGNCVVIKPSNYAKSTSDLIVKMIGETFLPEYVSVITGGREANQSLLQNKFDYIFFTGGETVGKIVMESASKHLTPLTLELGGKSPCIIDESAALKISAQRIAWGKTLNCGQTCVAPDYLLVHKNVKIEFLNHLMNYFKKFYGEDAHKNPDYPKMINQNHFDRINKLISSGGDVIYGGKSNPESLQISPTIIDNVSWDMPVMGEEIFGPILPVIVFDDINEVVKKLQSLPKPLALYMFTKNKKNERLVMDSCSFGGGCVNEVVTHMISHNMPFGGVGTSGMGKYHGKFSFDAFSNQKSILKKSTLWEPFVRYAPFNNLKFNLLKLFMK